MMAWLATVPLIRELLWMVRDVATYLKQYFRRQAIRKEQEQTKKDDDTAHQAVMNGNIDAINEMLNDKPCANPKL